MERNEDDLNQAPSVAVTGIRPAASQELEDPPGRSLEPAAVRAGKRPFKLDALPRAVVGAERAALEDFYRNQNWQGRQIRQLGPQPNLLRRPNHREKCQERVSDLLRCSIYPTTRAPDYVVDQLGYGDVLEEKRASVRRDGEAAAVLEFEDPPRLVRRTRSGIIANVPAQVKGKKEAKGASK